MRVSLKQMMLLVTLASVLCLFFFVVPSPLDLIVLVSLSFSILPAAVVVGIVHSRGDTRAFFLGAALGAGIPYFMLTLYFTLIMATNFESIMGAGDDLEDLSLAVKVSLGALWGVALASAIVSLLTYRWVKSADRLGNRSQSLTAEQAATPSSITST